MDCSGRGKCINNDLCDCSKSNFKGKFCEEYIKLERNSSIDILFITIASIIIFVIIIVIGITIYFRKRSIIKGGNNELILYKY